MTLECTLSSILYYFRISNIWASVLCMRILMPLCCSPLCTLMHTSCFCAPCASCLRASLLLVFVVLLALIPYLLEFLILCYMHFLVFVACISLGFCPSYAYPHAPVLLTFMHTYAYFMLLCILCFLPLSRYLLQ